MKIIDLKCFAMLLLGSILALGCGSSSVDDVFDDLLEDEMSDNEHSDDVAGDSVDVPEVDEPFVDNDAELVVLPADFQTASPPSWFGELEAPIRYNVNHADEPGNARMYTFENNSARLYGPMVGVGTVANTDNVKPLLLFGPTESVRHRIVGAYAVRSTRSPAGQTKVMLVVENPSSTMSCHHLGSVSFTHQTDHEVYGLDFNSSMWQYRPDGAAFQNSNPYVYSDCIPANSIVYSVKDASQQFGYGELDPLLLFDEVTGVTGGRGDTSGVNNNHLPLGGSVKPIAYGISENGLNVEITVQNQNPLYRYRIRQTAVYLLDDQGMPVGHVQAVGGVVYLDPGEEGIVSFRQSQFLGRASTMRVVVEAKFHEIAD